MVLEFKFTFPKMADAVKRALPDLKRKAMATVQTNRGMLFRNEGAYNGHPKWKELQARKGRILQDTGTLKNSIAPDAANKDMPQPGPDGILQFSGDTLKIGTNVAYASIHNYGGIIKAKNVPYLRWKDANGWHSKRSVTIPARPFLEGAWNQEDQKELDETIANAIARLIGSAV